MDVLLVADIQYGALTRDAVAKAVAAVAPLGPVTILCAASDAGAAAADAASIDGVAKVLRVDDAAYAHGAPEALAALAQGLAGAYGAVVAASTVASKAFMPRLGALLDVMVIPDVIQIEPETGRFTRPIYAGAALQTVTSSDPIKLITIRTAAYAPAGDAATPAPIETAAVGAAVDRAGRWVEDRPSEGDRPELTTAGVVVSGGRGVGSSDDFKIIEGLADSLGAAIGASRAAVDAGYAPNDWQVGQTGKVVAPELYVAVGISGAIQHLAGMKDSKV
ncbi:MAG: FAD-binding protein, partial [Pseudomonadota bacterium]